VRPAASPGPALGVCRAAWRLERVRVAGGTRGGPGAQIPSGRQSHVYTRTAALMKCRLGSPRRQGAHLKNANAIGKSRANRQNFY
jgi:hypothetical protein